MIDLGGLTLSTFHFFQFQFSSLWVEVGKLKRKLKAPWYEIYNWQSKLMLGNY